MEQGIGGNAEGKRWPSNLVLSHAPGCQRVGVKRVKGTPGGKAERTVSQDYFAQGGGGYKTVGRSQVTHADADGTEQVEEWVCSPSCPIAILDAQAGERKSGGKNVEAGYQRPGLRGNTITRPDAYEIAPSAGNASRFFPCFPPDEPLFFCALCGQQYKQKHGIMNEKQQGENTPCKIVNTAANPTSQKEATADFAHAPVQDMQTHKSGGKNQNKSKSAHNAARSSGNMPATIESAVPSSAWGWQLEHLVRSVQSAASLCERCATSIVQSLVNLWHKQDPTSLPGLASTVRCSESILLQNLASCVASLEAQGITLTTIDLTTLSGYVAHAISISIMQARNEAQQGGLGQNVSVSQVSQDLPILHETALYKYVSKPSRAERNAGCDGLPEQERQTQGRDEVRWIDRKDGKGRVPVNAQIRPAANDHPTLKSVSLMRWLVKLVTPPGGIILDPFAGSGTTGLAAIYEGYHYLLVEQDEHFCDIARSRISYAQTHPEARQPVKRARAAQKPTPSPDTTPAPVHVQRAPIPLATRRHKPALPPDVEQLALFG